jgi:CP family cyanate transporter-like MFS transporter
MEDAKRAGGTGAALTQSSNEAVRGRWRVVVVCALFTLVGINLRTVILAVPPVLPLIKRDLALSYTATGLLTSTPILLMAVAAWPAGTLAGRLGARRAVAWGLALLAAGTLLRAVWPSTVPLFIFTVLLSLGIAVGQTAMPVLARQWFPRRIGLISALFTDGLILGETIGAGLTVPVMLALLGRDAWPATFVVWGMPVVVTLALWLWLAPSASALNAGPLPRLLPSQRGRRRDAMSPVHVSGSENVRQPRVRAWQLGIVLGSASLIFFTMNGWIATYNQALQRSALTPLTLLVLNAAQLPVSFGMTPFAQRLAGRRWPFVTAGVICSMAIAGWLAMPAATEPVWVALLGGSSAFVFVLGIALPPLLAGREEVARLTGITLMLGYSIAFLGPLVGGGLWDLFALPGLAFAPVVAAALALIVLGALLPPRDSFGLHDNERSLPGAVGAAAPTSTTA